MDETAATPPPKRRRSIKDQIARRTASSEKLVALEARKVAIGELVAEQLDQLVGMLQDAGFKVSRAAPLPQQRVVIGEAQQPAQPPAQMPQAVKNPCVFCGQEAHGTEDMPDGQKRYLCRAHFMKRAQEKQEEANSNAILKQPPLVNVPGHQKPTVPKMVINAGPVDPFKGPLINPGGNGGPPPNRVLE